MKSLLVDALRQAQNGTDEKPGDRDGDVQECSTAQSTAPADVSADDSRDELSLLRTEELGAKTPFERTLDEKRDPTGATAPEAQAEEDSVSAEQHFEVMDLPADAKKIANKNRSLIVQVGRFSPLICLLAMSATTASYQIYQKLAVVTLNADLSEVSEHVQIDRRDNGSHSAWAGTTPSASVLSLVVPVDLIEQIYSSGGSIAKNVTPASVRNRGGNADVIASGRTSTVIDDKAFALVSAGYDAYRQHSFEEAEDHYRSALRIEPNHGNALMGLAAVLEKTSRSTEALQHYERLLNVDPDNTVAISAIFLSQPAEVDVESSLKLLLQKHPKAAQLHFALGSYLARQNRWQEARLSFSSAYQIDPDDSDNSYNLAVSMEQTGQIEKARFYYQTALRTATSDSTLDRQAIAKRIDRLSTVASEPT